MSAATVLLVHPLGYRAEAAGTDISRVANLMPPLGLASIAAFLNRRGIPTRIVDCFANPDADERIRRIVRDEKPGFVGFSCTTSSFLDGVRISRLAKAESPGIRTVFGGAHVAALKERILREYPEVDYVVAGEGEETLAELVESGGEGAEAITGVVARAGGDVVFAGYREKGLVLDDLPFPAYEQLDGYPGAYRLPIFNYPKTPNSSCISSRGCPYACTYCDRSVFRRTFRYNSAEYLYEHLRYLRERFGIRHVNFYDDQFTFNRQRVADFCGMMDARPLRMTWNCAVRAEHVDPELLRMMKSSGCWMVSLGIETGDEALLSRHRQRPDLDRLAETVRQVSRAGIRVKGLFMLGLPGETEESVATSMRYAFSLPIDDINVSKFTPFPGSPVYETVREHGTFDEDWEAMDCMHFQFVPRGLTRERLEALHQEFYKRHFMRPRILLSYVAMAWRSPDSWVRFLANLGSFLSFARSERRHR